MLFVGFLLLLVVHNPVSHAASNNSITATGGGIVEKGQDLVLTYNIDQVDDKWFMCRWSRFEPVIGNAGDPSEEYCLFTDITSTSTGNVSKQLCNPSDFMETNQMEYIGTTKNECKIKINNVSLDDSVTWAVNIESDATSRKIDVTVATPLDNITQIVAPDPIEAGTEGMISCTVTGGEPTPTITYIYGAIANNANLTVTNRTQDSVKLDNGKFKTVLNSTIKPEFEDHSRQINCVAIQYDKSDPPQILFKESQGTNGTLNASPITLNVVFPPQESDSNQTFHYVKGEEAKISVIFVANPAPTSITWIIQNPNDTDAGNNTDNQSPSTNGSTNAVSIELPSTEDRNRYTLYNISAQSSIQYLANLTIANISNSDHLNIYYLMVANSLGMQNYYFDINITDFVPSTTAIPPTTTTQTVDNTTQTPEGKSSSGAVTAIVVIVVIIILIAAGVIFYKKYYLHRQTVPHYNLR